MTELEPLDVPDLASRFEPGDRVPWLRLELLALRSRPELRALLDPDATAPLDRGGQEGCLPLGLACIGLGGGLGASYLAGRTTPRGYFEVAPYATAGAVLTGLLVPVLVALVVPMLRRRTPAAPGGGAGSGASGVVGLLAAVGGWVALFSRTPEARTWDADHWWAWAPSTIACVVLGVALMVLAVRRMATADPPVTSTAAEGVAEEPRRRAAADEVLAGMPSWTRAFAEREIVEAVEDLHARGVISADEADRARSAPLGRLAATMAGDPGPR